MSLLLRTVVVVNVGTADIVVAVMMVVNVVVVVNAIEFWKSLMLCLSLLSQLLIIFTFVNERWLMFLNAAKFENNCCWCECRYCWELLLLWMLFLFWILLELWILMLLTILIHSWMLWTLCYLCEWCCYCCYECCNCWEGSCCELLLSPFMLLLLREFLMFRWSLLL